MLYSVGYNTILIIINFLVVFLLLLALVIYYYVLFLLSFCFLEAADASPIIRSADKIAGVKTVGTLKQTTTMKSPKTGKEK